jgi:PPM family protein phosphatase
MQVRVGSVTDTGLRREANEDSILVNAQAGVFAVCDGVGGRAGGQEASRTAVASLDRVITGGQRRAQRLEGEMLAVADAIRAAHADIRAKQAQDPALRQMASTVAMLRLWGDYAITGHVGDCRVFHIGNDGIQRLTRDHSRVQQLIDSGRMTAEEAEKSPERNVITRSLGVRDDIGNIDIHCVAVYPGDVFALASDGITSYVSDGDFFVTIGERNTPPQAACELFKQRAYDGGAHDNLSVVVVRIEESASESLSTLATPVV